MYGVAAFAIIAILSSSLTRRYLIESRSKTLYDEAMLIASTYSGVYEGEEIDLNAAGPQIKAVATFLDSEIWIIGKDGKIIASSDNTKTGMVVKDFDPTLTGNKSYVTGNYFGTFPEEVLSVTAPIVGQNRTNGYVVIHLPMSMVTQSQNQILRIVYITAAIIFLLSMSILIMMHAFVYRPLRKITNAAKQYALGNLGYHVDVDTHDEMGYLADTLNDMSSELNSADEYQHKFIANVSHDFRSPLTSIKGYLEAILDGTIPKDKQETYLKRVIGETERLTKLTQSMLALNSMDIEGKIVRSVFDINRVIRDTALSFEVQCNEKKITIELTYDDEKEAVYADVEKIRQVLYNLIDNAIKFSDPESSIYVTTSKRDEKIFVSVKDDGIGIPKSDVKKIFDRFYKADASRGKDKKGTGLGLSIVKEIIQAHGENIEVISNEGVGTEFVFSLPIAHESEE